MRADRLLSLMMLLQSRGKMTARELATELEVSERTIYRDIDALSIAGVPVYADRGPGGGCGLLHDYRVRLTGLTDAEIQAFFMLRIPTTLAALGADQEAQSALLKIAAALPGDQWHLVYGWQTTPHILPVDKVLEVQILDDLCDRPIDFDLKRFWQQWSATLESNQAEYLATLLVNSQILGTVAHSLGVNASALLVHGEPPDVDGRVRLTAPFQSFAEARTSVLGWGQAVEVLAPRALRLSVADFATQIVALYAEA